MINLEVTLLNGDQFTGIRWKPVSQIQPLLWTASVQEQKESRLDL